MTTSIPKASMRKDVYKEAHNDAYHKEIDTVYTNYISRSNTHSNVPDSSFVVVVGNQTFVLDHIVNEWEAFFKLPKEKAIRNHRRILSSMLNSDIDMTALGELHDLGYLPITIKALPEGTFAPYQVPAISIVNNPVPEGAGNFRWLPNSLEVAMSSYNWPIQTSTTTAVAYYMEFLRFAELTGLDPEFCKNQGHDFSMRGMCPQGGEFSSFGHLASGLVGTDTITAVLHAEEFYGANVDNEVVGSSIRATEHSVTCSAIFVYAKQLEEHGYAGIWSREELNGIFSEDTDPLLLCEFVYYHYLITEVWPHQDVALVCDSFDFFAVVEFVIPALKPYIMARKGFVSFRPDSGDPVKILTGYTRTTVTEFFKPTTDKEFEREVALNSNCECYEVAQSDGTSKFYDVTNDRELLAVEAKGLIECQYEIFGGIKTDKGYIVTDEHIGAVYGDSITLARQTQILQRLMDKGFSSKVILGIGSYTYQYVTRDTHGSAIKATSVTTATDRIAVYKEPKTDMSKKSARGLLAVVRNEEGVLIRLDDVSEEVEANQNLLETIFKDGKVVKTYTLIEIRKTVKDQIDAILAK